MQLNTVSFKPTEFGNGDWHKMTAVCLWLQIDQRLIDENVIQHRASRLIHDITSMVLVPNHAHNQPSVSNNVYSLYIGLYE